MQIIFLTFADYRRRVYRSVLTLYQRCRMKTIHNNFLYSTNLLQLKLLIIGLDSPKRFISPIEYYDILKMKRFISQQNYRIGDSYSIGRKQLLPRSRLIGNWKKSFSWEKKFFLVWEKKIFLDLLQVHLKTMPFSKV